jgi:tryptophan synthase beta chain
VTAKTIYNLDTDALPSAWLNIAAQIPYELPLPIDAVTGEPPSVESLAKLYPSECARIELLVGEYKTAPRIAIPTAVLAEYAKYRPTPLYRARGLENALGYAGAIYFKREDFNPSGSHKPNTSLAQAYYGKADGLARLVTDTGAGQWGTALAYSCRRFDLDCSIFMTRKSYTDKPYRSTMMRLCGAEVFPSPSDRTKTGRDLLAEDPHHAGSLGIGMAEAVEYVNSVSNTRLALGCMSYYAALHQTVIGLEVEDQVKITGDVPDTMIGCVGGGTNFIGFVAPFIIDRINGHNNIDFVAVESASIPVLTDGEYRYDFADYAGFTPKVKMYTLGHDFVPPPIHSGGLRYHGKSPILSLLYHHGQLRATSVQQEEAFAAGRLFLEHEGILPAPETNHAIAQVIREVKRSMAEGVVRNIYFCFSGTGYLDLKSYADAAAS